MLTNPSDPTPGSISSCLSLPAVVRELQAMHQRAEVNGFVTVAEAHRFAELLSAWEYYRESQPIGYQGRIDALVEAIACYAVGGVA